MRSRAEASGQGNSWQWRIWRESRYCVACQNRLGGGIPLGATLSSSKIMSWLPGTHANTFGGTSLLRLEDWRRLEFMESSKLGEKAVEKGNYLMKRLNELKDKYPIIGDVRGIGLMIGVELVDKIDRQHLPGVDVIIKKALDGGVILLPAGDSVNQVRATVIIKKLRS